MDETSKPAVVHDPPNSKKIEHLWAFLSVDEHGEGIICAHIAGTMMPLIAADEDRLGSLKPLALEIAKLTKKQIRLVKFTGMEVLDTLT